MSKNKRKVVRKSNCKEEDSFKNRRSSLRVNLSYITNLTDSGNGSFKQTQSELGNTVINSLKNVTRPPEEEGNIDGKIRTQHHDICLKNVSVVLEKISCDDLMLDRSSKQLKTAILSKTNQIFNTESELSLKTALILGSKDSKTSNIQNPCKTNSSVCNISKNDGSKIQYNTNDQHRKETNNKLNQSFDSTPRNKSKTINKSKDKGKLKKKRLFLESQHVNETDAQNTSRKSMNPLLQSPSMNISKAEHTSMKGDEIPISPILSGYRKSLSRPKCSLTLYNQPTLSISSSLDDDILYEATPIGCSTLVEHDILSKDAGVHSEMIDNNSQKSLPGFTKNTMISMEMTDMRGGFICDSKYRSRKNAKNNELCSSSEQEYALKNNSNFTPPLNRSLRKNVVVKESVHTKPTEYKEYSNNVSDRIAKTKSPLERTSTCRKSVLLKETKISENICNSLNRNDENSMRELQTSLDVNTSIDAINEKTSNRGNSSQVISCGEKTNRLPINAQMEQDSVNTVHTSLQMNTSLDRSNGLCLEEKNNESMKSVSRHINKEREEGMPTINLSNTSNSNTTRDARLAASGGEHEPMSKDHNLDCNNKNVISKKAEITLDKSNKAESYIESTPYPTSRSMLVKLLLTQNTLAQQLNVEHSKPSSTASNLNYSNSNLKHDEISGSKSKLYYPNRNRGSEDEKGMVILDDSSSNKSPSAPQVTLIVQDSSDEVRLEENEDILSSKDIPHTPKRNNKRKLLSLHENSQLLSFTPVHDEDLPLKQRVFIPRKKKIERSYSRTKTKLIHNANDTANLERLSNEHSLLENDLNSLHDKKEKERKPRKVLSKKIVIKKFADRDIFKRLQNRNENCNETQESQCVTSGNSLNDFQAGKTLSTKSKKCSHKIIIVTTGLSHEDKNLVKSVVKALGSARIEATVTRRTTHVVCTGVRTVNLLHGIIKGCWLVSFEWVLKSLENNAWLNPDKYEMAHFSKAVVENRRDKQLFGASYVPELFTTCGYIYIENATIPPCQVLKDLVKAAGGRITEDIRAAKIIIGKEGLKETWILDCITTGELQSCNHYERK